VLIDGQPLDRWNAQTLRSQIALVAQGDLERMPMGYESLVGDMGSTLSALAITRLVVAHRPETLRAAGRVITLEGGVAREASAVSK
jgi:ABC-type bacteriocin/lantibiotic exporter with double-glycine peptidase domain